MPKKIYIVVGEPSGDALGSRLMEALRKTLPSVEFYGLGGETMTAAGLRSLFDIADLSVMGIWEVLPHLPLLLRRIRQTAADIAAVKPDALVTIDSWGFVHQLLNRIKKHGCTMPKIHYVAPQVWAWKRGRAKTAAKLLDALLTLLPAEAPYFERHGLACTFVGHPVVENTAGIHFDNAAFRSRHGIAPDSEILCVLPGSRHGEIARLSPIFNEVIRGLLPKYPRMTAVIPSVAAMAARVQAAFANCAAPCRILTGTTEKYAAFHACHAALAASGTVSLELAACGAPHVVAYRFSRLSNLLAQILVKPHTRFANLLNILADSEIVPECMLSDCKASYILPRMLTLMGDSAAAAAQVSAAAISLQKLSPQGMPPSQQAAKAVTALINN
jgi:lipid-A-disaccharide synthase